VLLGVGGAGVGVGVALGDPDAAFRGGQHLGPVRVVLHVGRIPGAVGEDSAVRGEDRDPAVHAGGEARDPLLDSRFPRPAFEIRRQEPRLP